MSYLQARRYGLTFVDPSDPVTDALRQGGWRQVWRHPSGLMAARNPATGRWHVTDGYSIGPGWSSSLRAAAAKITRTPRPDYGPRVDWPERYTDGPI